MEERIAGTRRKSPKQDLTSAKDLPIKGNWYRRCYQYLLNDYTLKMQMFAHYFRSIIVHITFSNLFEILIRQMHVKH